MTYAVSTVPRQSSRQPLSTDCPWCRRLLPLCNGERTVQEISSALYLPHQVVLKLIRHAVKQGWLDLPGEENPAGQEPGNPEGKSEHYRALQGELNILLGEKGTHLLSEATRMTRVTPAQLTSQHTSDVLIALELLLPREQAETYGPQFDSLRDVYAS